MAPFSSALLGTSVFLVCPALLVAVSDAAHPARPAFLWGLPALSRRRLRDRRPHRGATAARSRTRCPARCMRTIQSLEGPRRLGAIRESRRSSLSVFHPLLW